MCLYMHTIYSGKAKGGTERSHTDNCEIGLGYLLDVKNMPNICNLERWWCHCFIFPELSNWEKKHSHFWGAGAT